MNLCPLVRDGGQQQVFAGVNRGSNTQLSYAQPSGLATQRLDIGQSAAGVAREIEPQSVISVKFALLGACNSLSRQSALCQSEEFPPLVVGQWPLGRVGITV